MTRGPSGLPLLAVKVQYAEYHPPTHPGDYWLHWIKRTRRAGGRALRQGYMAAGQVAPWGPAGSPSAARGRAVRGLHRAARGMTGGREFRQKGYVNKLTQLISYLYMCLCYLCYPYVPSYGQVILL